MRMMMAGGLYLVEPLKLNLIFGKALKTTQKLPQSTPAPGPAASSPFGQNNDLEIIFLKLTGLKLESSYFHYTIV